MFAHTNARTYSSTKPKLLPISSISKLFFQEALFITLHSIQLLQPLPLILFHPRPLRLLLPFRLGHAGIRVTLLLLSARGNYRAIAADGREQSRILHGDFVQSTPRHQFQRGARIRRRFDQVGYREGGAVDQLYDGGFGLRPGELDGEDGFGRVLEDGVEFRGGYRRDGTGVGHGGEYERGGGDEEVGQEGATLHHAVVGRFIVATVWDFSMEL